MDAIVTAFAALPLDAAAQPGRRASRMRPRARTLRVLVAEDNPTNQKLLLALLRQGGHRVTIVGNGRQAVETSAARRFDVILMDVQMPEMDGLEATMAIRARDATRWPRSYRAHRARHVRRSRAVLRGDDAYVSNPPAGEVFGHDRLCARAGRTVAGASTVRRSHLHGTDRATLLAA
jgi:CheY-like chemotaxis protein